MQDIPNRAREYKYISDAISVHNGHKFSDALGKYLLVLLTNTLLGKLTIIIKNGICGLNRFNFLCANINI